MNVEKEAEKYIEEQQALFIRLYRNSIAIVDKVSLTNCYTLYFGNA
jgi:hypothetical protein